MKQYFCFTAEKNIYLCWKSVHRKTTVWKTSPGDIIYLYINVGVDSIQTVWIELLLYMSRYSHSTSIVQKWGYMQHVSISFDSVFFVALALRKPLINIYIVHYSCGLFSPKSHLQISSFVWRKVKNTSKDINKNNNYKEIQHTALWKKECYRINRNKNRVDMLQLIYIHSLPTITNWY